MKPDALVAAVGTEIYTGDGERMPDWPSVDSWDAQKIRSLLAHIPTLELQPASGQRQHKVGYFLKDNEHVFRLVQKTLKDYPAEVVYCQGIYLDVLPKGSHKGGSIRFLAEQWQIDADDIIACGDSGNDISMLKENKAIIVGNARDELLQWVNKSKPTNTYMAQASFAGGIIEGLKHYQVIS
jgi:sucrose-6F-phosphate phosphohydrolase